MERKPGAHEKRVASRPSLRAEGVRMKKSDIQKGHYYVARRGSFDVSSTSTMMMGPIGLSGMTRSGVGTASSSLSPPGRGGKSRKRTSGSITSR
jgi:hypothetical protein